MLNLIYYIVLMMVNSDYYLFIFSYWWLTVSVSASHDNRQALSFLSLFGLPLNRHSSPCIALERDFSQKPTKPRSGAGACYSLWSSGGNVT